MNVTFCAWLANNMSKHLLKETKKVARHGGEVYAETFRKANEVLSRYERPLLTPRFPNASPAIVVFRIHSNDTQMMSEHGQVEKLLNDLAQGITCFVEDAWEFKFLSHLPANRIIWVGPLDQYGDLIEPTPISPTAKERLAVLKSCHA